MRRALIDTARGTIVQLHTPNALLGRVVAAEQIVGQAAPDIGNMRAGLIAGATSGVASLVSGGLLCMATVALICAATRELRARWPLAHRAVDLADAVEGGGAC